MMKIPEMVSNDELKDYVFLYPKFLIFITKIYDFNI